MIRWLLLAAAVLAAAPASALVINGSFRTSGFVQGYRVDQSGGFNDNNAARGGGNLTSIFAAAADYWEREFLDDRTISVVFGWSNDQRLTSSTLAVAAGNNILVNTRSVPFFLDATPTENEEFAADEFGYVDLGYGPLTLGDRLTRLDDRRAIDLLSTVIHELGHVLSGSYFPGDGDDPLKLTAPRPFAGMEIPVYPGGSRGHIALPDGYELSAPRPIMDAGPDGYARSLISDIDVLAIAEAGGFELLARFPADEVPEPAGLGLLALGAVGLLSRRAGRSAGRR